MTTILEVGGGPGPPTHNKNNHCSSGSNKQMRFSVCALLFFGVLIMGVQNGNAEKSKYYSMQSLCKNHFLQQLYRKIDGAVLWSKNERNLDCVITFQTHSILQRFMLRFDFLQLDCNDHLYIYDGAHAVGTYKFDLSCKDTKQSLNPMFTRTNYVTLKYVTDAWGVDSNGFNLVITAVKDPKHPCAEFRCKLREFCIATDLVCDGINHCADGSDETSTNPLCQNNETGTIMGLEVTWFVVALISSILGLLVFSVGISVCMFRLRYMQLPVGQNIRSGNGNVPQQNASYSLQQMYGSNGAMKQPCTVGIGGSLTALTGDSGCTVTDTLIHNQGNWCHPAGPLGFRLSTPARVRLYCQAK